MAALDGAVRVEANAGENVAAKTLDQRQTLARLAGAGDRRPRFAGGQAVEYLVDQAEALLDLADPDPHPRVDVALAEHGVSNQSLS